MLRCLQDRIEKELNTQHSPRTSPPPPPHKPTTRCCRCCCCTCPSYTACSCWRPRWGRSGPADNPCSCWRTWRIPRTARTCRRGSLCTCWRSSHRWRRSTCLPRSPCSSWPPPPLSRNQLDTAYGHKPQQQHSPGLMSSFCHRLSSDESGRPRRLLIQ